MRIVGIFIISACLGLLGFLMNEKLLLRRRRLKELSDITIRICNRICDGGSTVFEIFTSEGDNFPMLKNIDKSVMNSEDLLKKVLLDFSIDKRDLADAQGFFSNLGLGNTEEQRRHCLMYHEIFSNNYSNATKECSEKGRLYKSLSIALGLTVFIILI